jgi:D-xylose transport system substrate-binding protein
VRAPRSSIVTIFVVTAFGLGACSSSGGSSSPAGVTDGNVGTTAACGLSTLSTSGAASATAAAPPDVSGEVGVILPAPGLRSGATEHEGALLRAALEAAGMTAYLRKATATVHASATIARRMISEGAQVLLVDPFSEASGAEVQRAADEAGVPVIDYQHMSPGGSADYFVSFDYEDIGKLQAEATVECLDARGITHPRIILVDGGTDVDENAVLMAIGAHEVLDPLVSAGKADVVETTVKGWQAARAARTFTQALIASGGKADAVLAGNDAIAAAVVRVLQARGLGRTVVSGQGSGNAALKRVANGLQSATVLTDPELQADAAAQLAAALVSGGTRALARVPLSAFVDPRLPGHRAKALLLPGRLITRANVADGAGALRTTPAP